MLMFSMDISLNFNFPNLWLIALSKDSCRLLVVNVYLFQLKFNKCSLIKSFSSISSCFETLFDGLIWNSLLVSYSQIPGLFTMRESTIFVLGLYGLYFVDLSLV